MSSSIIKRTSRMTAIVTAFFILINPSYANDKSLSNPRKAQLTHMVKQDCGSCHGMTLKGGLGPAL
ncbi:MAG: hypothetical protein QNK36_19105, partial [Colwellia sp.]|nr:hypothetical protein [Colwellia sp.]